MEKSDYDLCVDTSANDGVSDTSEINPVVNPYAAWTLKNTCNVCPNFVIYIRLWIEQQRTIISLVL